MATLIPTPNDESFVVATKRVWDAKRAERAAACPICAGLWDMTDNHRALGEGWLIGRLGGRPWVWTWLITDYVLSPTFKSPYEAEKFVQDNAQNGDRFYQRALAMVAALNIDDEQ